MSDIPSARPYYTIEAAVSSELGVEVHQQPALLDGLSTI